MSNTMTPKRAIEILKKLTYIKVLENNAHSNEVIHSEEACKKDNEDLAAIQMAISALEYQTAKTPMCSITPFYKCPSCGNEIYENQKHCDDCGQALDWSDEK